MGINIQVKSSRTIINQMEPSQETQPLNKPPAILPFKISIYTNEDPIYRQKSASQLRDLLNQDFKLNPIFTSKQIFCMEIKYTVEKNEAIVKLGETLKASPFNIDTSYNRIDCSDFARQIFKDCDLISKKSPTQNIDQILLQLPKVEDQESDKLMVILGRFMKIYNLNESGEYIKGTQLSKTQINTRDKIKITGLLRMREKDFQTTFDKHMFEDGSSQMKKSKFFIKSLSDRSLRYYRQCKEEGMIVGWKAGIIHSNCFVPFFDNEKLGEKLIKINSSVKIKSGLLRDADSKVKKFQIYSIYFQGLVVKLEFKKVHISEIYKRKENDETVYYIKTDYPPKFYAHQMDSKLDQEMGLISNWKRIQNFTLIDHNQIKDNQLLRLHIFNNTVIRIEIKPNMNKKSFLFFQELYQEFETKSKPAIFGQDKNATIRNICTQVDYNSFSKRLLNVMNNDVEAKIKNEELRWNINYLILCLVSKGLLTAFEAMELIQYIESQKNYLVFVYVFDKMYQSENSQGLAYIKKGFEEYKHLETGMMSTDYDQDSLAARVWRIQITPSGYLYGNKAPEMKNRIQREYQEVFDHFMRASVLDDDGSEIKNQSYMNKKVFRKLISEFKILNRKFIPLGWSPSQLRSFSLWYIHEIETQNKLKRGQILNFLGKFEDISPPAKMAARIGQAFSSSWNAEIRNLEKVKVEMIDDISVFNTKIGKELLFTDGIGKISQNLIQTITLKLKLHEEIGAIQVRYLGAKGVLVIDQTLPKNTIQLRPSMVKYQCSHPNAKKYLDILDWNKFKSGFLNRQVIILLRSRGISNEVFIKLQNDYIKDIQNLTYKECSIFKEMVSDDHNEGLFNLDPASKIILNLMSSGFNLDEEPFFRGVMQILKRNGYEKLKEKSNINVPKSARLIGIIDEFKVLKENEVYCRIIDPTNKEQYKEAKTISSQVIVVRNPCLHPADIRKLTAVSEEVIVSRFGNSQHPFKLYPNTVIMPQAGDTPITSAISGSDLDGDNFWICWDQNLIGVTDEDPFIHIDETKKKKKDDHEPKITVDDECYNEMLEFFCNYMNYDLLGKIANAHLIKADMNMIKQAYDEQCLELAVAHGHAVDFPKSGYVPPIAPDLLQVSKYPDFLEKQDHEAYISESILGILYRGIKERIEAPIIEEKETKGVAEYFDDDLIDSEPQRSFTMEQMLQTLEVLYLFSEDLQRILYLANLENEFQVYTGNVTAKTKGKPKKNKGFKHGKLMEQIIILKSKFQRIFFSKLEKGEEQFQQYRQETQSQERQFNSGEKTFNFSDQTLSKASLWYLVSYSEFFKEKITCKNPEFQKTFRQTLIEAKKKSRFSKREVNHLGLVWFIIPKVLMEMKRRAVKKRQEKEQIEKDIKADQPEDVLGEDVDQSHYTNEESSRYQTNPNQSGIEERNTQIVKQDSNEE